MKNKDFAFVLSKIVGKDPRKMFKTKSGAYCYKDKSGWYQLKNNIFSISKYEKQFLGYGYETVHKIYAYKVIKENDNIIRLEKT